MARQLLIFDLDGTLLDTVGDLAAAVNLTRGRFGLPPLDTGVVAGFIGDGVRMLISRAMQGADVDIDRAVDLHRAFYLEHLHDATRPYPGVCEGLRRLRDAGHVLAVATNKNHESCLRLLDHFGFSSLLHDVLGGGSVENLKPHPEMLQVIMRSAGFDPARTWMIGDHRTDLEAARRAGVRSAFLTCGIGHTGDEQPTIELPSFGAFVEHILGA